MTSANFQIYPADGTWVASFEANPDSTYRTPALRAGTYLISGGSLSYPAAWHGPAYTSQAARPIVVGSSDATVTLRMP